MSDTTRVNIQPATPPCSSPTEFIAPLCTEQIDILFQDDDIMLINKPSGLLSLSGKNPANKDSVHYRLAQQYPTVKMVHRLDLGTSGIMVLAFTNTATAHLCRQFQERRVEKTYIAILSGHLERRSGIIDIPIIKDKDNFPLQKVCTETGKSAQSDYTVIEYIQQPSSSRVLYKPLTGRTHQLRIHSREIGHPILGCDLYAPENISHLANRLMLHACTLVFEHPASGKQINAECPCPF